VVIVGVVLFASAGSVRLPQVWVYLGFWMASTIAALAMLDPELLSERERPGGGEWIYRRPVALFVIPWALGHWVVAGLDVGRFHWSDDVPGAAIAGGLAAQAIAIGLGLWAMYVNPFFSSLVRIQTERGHHVIDRGPYAVVRHPGYVAGVVQCLSSGLALGSWWSVAIALPALPAILWRTMREDRVLRRELPGYADYAARVRYRLVPGLW
jgi:protein-S-isoprenylcysteine O-methyltransferase Ste14